MFSKFCASIVLFVALSQCAFTQNNDYQFTRLDITNGLSNNRINCIYKDAEGFMWFGTTSGLNRYDGYEFKVFKNDPSDRTSLFSNYITNLYEGPDHKMWVYTNYGISVYDPATGKFNNDLTSQLAAYKVYTNDVTSITKDSNGNFWFVTLRRGIYRYDTKTRETSFYNTLPKSKITLHSSYVTAAIAGEDVLWIVYNDGVIDELNINTNQIIQRNYSLRDANGGKGKSYSGIIDGKQNLWIYVTEDPIGVYEYNTKANNLQHFVKGGQGISLNSNIINNIVQGDDNNVWIGTDHGGVNLVNTDKQTVSYILNRPDDPRSLPGNSATLYKDNTGIIWAGSFKQGISYYHKGIIQFPLLRHYDLDNTSLPNDDVDSFVEDANGNIWIGTNGGGLIVFDPKTKKYTQYKHDANNPNSLTNDIVISLCIDHEHKLWIGTYFGGLDSFDGKTFTHYKHNENVANSLGDDRVYNIIEDSDNKLWVGTFAGPLNVYNRQNNNFDHPQYPMQSEYTALFYEDRQKNLWIGRDNGIDVINSKRTSVKHYYNNPGNHNSLVANDVNSIIQDHNGLMWIGTKEGLSILNPESGKFTNIEQKQGLPSNNIWNVLEDNTGRVWTSTGNGIASVVLNKGGYEIHKYNEADGLQGREFNAYAALKTRDGHLIFGGPHGFNYFSPAMIKSSGLKPPLVFTDFQLFNKSVNVGDTVVGKVVLDRAITESPALELNHGENDFSISFAACDYFNPDKITYQYMLKGFDEGWINSSATSRKATYTNLDAGDYVFKVRAINANDPGSENMITLDIKILPPFWKTAWAYILYAAAVAGFLFYIRHRGILKLKKEFVATQEKLEAGRKLQSEREEANRMHELDLMKIKFFTNVSHEFRTPLSLIISPIETLIKNTDKPEQKNQLVMIKRNGRRLLNLVNQLLDFRKMEARELKLALRKGEIIEFIREACCSFNDLAGQNHIDYLFESEVPVLVTIFDHDKIERILFNLLSNAFKFTPAGGHISVMLNLIDTVKQDDDTKLLEIKVIDTGIGISEEKKEKIFERFFQENTPESLLNQGSGIGLSISQEFVKMHDGEIFVESEPGNGSTFIVRLPLNVEDEKYIPAAPLAKSGNTTLKPVHNHVLDSEKKSTVLLVEDNDDLRFYLKDNLKHVFNIVEAINGREGWQKALALHPNLIVSDVTMPEMTGIELCKKIREDSRTAHIPVILLTALIEEEDQLTGLSNGANDYITKPFNFEILLSKINGLLLMQQTLKKTYQKQKEIQVQELEIVSEDDKFLKAAFDCIENNITNYNFSVEELSRQMALSRVSLYKRMLALTGKTPVDCIRTVRLKRAVQLLEKSQLSIANIAYEVGFNNPTYFSKVFKDEYGIVPSEYVIAIRNKEKEAEAIQ